ncbi:hypothetical protein MPH48_15355 [Lysinibacillus fusiformis]|uniref:hypothetical protein n=1 Tax=Lysinibacillus fusiformis TaxID=28031 RepID=UPI001F4DBCCD|nr:hypothetical protein [Lysinibacillus fusiformis]MCK1989472.1 hypothetical protein [Lysinibacillus fusiformis]
MIDIVKHIPETLASLNLPKLFNTVPTGAEIPDQYITFLEINAKPALEASDQEYETERLIQVNVWSRPNYYQLVEDIKRLMESAGYERTIEYDAPKQEGDSHFNKVLRFVFFDEY